MDGKTKQWTGTVHLVDINLFDHRASTWADTVLLTGSGESVHGHGRARRSPGDLDVPDIGRGLAAARALRDLAERLLELAAEAAQPRSTFSPYRGGDRAPAVAGGHPGGEGVSGCCRLPCTTYTAWGGSGTCPIRGRGRQSARPR